MDNQISMNTSETKLYLTVPLIVAAVLLILLLATAGNYGIFRDELYYMACGEHLDFGYVDHPPLIGLIARLSTILFGTSLPALRFWPALAGSATVLITAASAKELGGGRFAQSLAALTILFATVFPTLLSFLSMNAFDILLVALCTYLLIRILNGASPKLWLIFGLVAGIGLQNKITMLIYGFAVFVGLLLTRKRNLLASPWPWIGGLIAALIFLPNVIWQIAHGWPTLEFISNAQQYKNYPVSLLDFVLQLTVALNPLTLPIWILGLLFLFFSKDSANFRPLGIVFIICLIVFVSERSKFYYILPVIPLLMAAGAVGIERFARLFSRAWFKPAVIAVLILSGIPLMPLGVPILPVDVFIPYSQAIGLLETIKIERHERVALPQHFADRFGWKEITETVAGVYSKLPEGEKAKCAILARNYGEAGAIDYFGPELGLPKAICGHNSYGLWGTRNYLGEIVITVGFRKERLEELFGSVELAATAGNPYAMAYEANLLIFICRNPVAPLRKLWPSLVFYI